MSKPLLIVESPTKVKTLKKYLGEDYKVSATAGHIKDLPEKELGIDIENDFKANYLNIKGKSKIINELKSAAGDTDIIYLAPDPDREGEAIAFHTAEILKKKGRKFYRVLIHELTKKGITEALSHPTELNNDKYEAQQTRRTLDRLVGYQISPLLWRRVQGSLSAGRVQSVAVRIICDRENEIQAFNPEEYWTITADFLAEIPPLFSASLSKKKGKKLIISNEKSASKIMSELKSSTFSIDKISVKTLQRTPLPPFITSKLQQDAINSLKFSAKKTMAVAQQLYEGIEIGIGGQNGVSGENSIEDQNGHDEEQNGHGGPEGLITYMRTDSTRISEDAAKEALNWIRNKLGDQYAMENPRFFKNKNNAQDAHEAIRPTSVLNTPEKVQPYLTEDQFKLYNLIWQRFVASQMTQAVIDQKTISIKAGEYTFTVGGNTVQFKGFMALYSDNDEKEKQTIPELTEGMKLEAKKITPTQHFTKPPPRFSEASLVKELEENGIGRPSTYATILSTIRDKGYVDLIKKYFAPNELGFIVNELLVNSFPEILDATFTAEMENKLDNIENGTHKSIQVLNEFYAPFKERLAHATANMISVKGVGLPTKLQCPVCSKQLNIKIGKNGHFIACTGYPECSFSSNYTRNEKGDIEINETKVDLTPVKDCEKCGKPMLKKEGRYGEFLACTGYPECKHTESLSALATEPVKLTNIRCPLPGCKGMIVEKKSRRGKDFYGCDRYPECELASWAKPVNMECPKCGSPYLVEKETKKDGLILKCPGKGCDYKA